MINLIQTLIQSFQGTHLAHSLSHQFSGAGRTVVAQTAMHPSQRFHNPAGMVHFPEFPFQILILPRLQCGVIDLLYFKLQEVNLPYPLFFIHLAFFQFFFCPAVNFITIPHLLFESRQFLPGKFIQNIQLFLRIQQGLMLVLTVNIQKKSGRLFHLADCTRLSIDAADAAPFHDLPA